MKQMKNLLKLKTISPIEKLIMIIIEDNTYWGICSLTSQEIANHIGESRNKVLNGLKSLEENCYIKSEVNGNYRERNIIYTNKLIKLLNGDNNN